MTYVAHITTLTHLMYHKYLQVCFNIRSRKIGVEDDQSFGRLIDDITVFAPVGLYSSYVACMDMLCEFLFLFS